MNSADYGVPSLAGREAAQLGWPRGSLKKMPTLHEPSTELPSAAVYSPWVLAVYDAWVLGFSNRWLWRSPTPQLLTHYQRYVSRNHLDVGVGTGYFLDRCRFGSDRPRIALLDANPHALRAAAKRVARWQPEIYQADILQPLHLEAAPFDSIGLNYVLHCLPGDMREKSAVLGRLAAYLRPGGVLFGATLLGRDVPRSRAAKWLMDRYNARGIFANREDDLAGLRAALEVHLADITLTTIGCAALFAGRARSSARQ